MALLFLQQETEITNEADAMSVELSRSDTEGQETEVCQTYLLDVVEFYGNHILRRIA